MKTWRWYSFRRVGFVVLLSLFVLFIGNWVAQRQQIDEQFDQIEQQMNDCQLAAKQSRIDETTIEDLVKWYDGMRAIYYDLNKSSRFLPSFIEEQDQKRFEKNMQVFFTYIKTYHQSLIREVKKSIEIKDGFVPFGEYECYSFILPVE